jgi:hypothetical protein
VNDNDLPAIYLETWGGDLGYEKFTFMEKHITGFKDILI